MRTIPSPSTSAGPDTFAFDAETGVALSALTTSDAETLNGAAGDVWPVTVRGDGSPQISVNSGAWGTDALAIDGDEIEVRLTASGSADTELIATVYAPNTSAEYSVTTTDLWLPNVLSPSLWNRADSLALADNAGVTSWTDDSGNARHMVEASTPPTFKTNILNGLPIVRFDGINDKLDGSVLSTMFSNSAFTVFVVVKAVSVSTNSVDIYNNDTILTSSAGGYLGISLKSVGPTVSGYNYDGSYDVPTAIATDLTDFHILTYRHESGTLYLGMDGNTENSAASGNTQAMTDVLRYGQTYNGGVKATIDIAEVVIFPVALSSGDVAKVQGYLAHKWDLADFLPGGHTYKAGPP